MPVSVSYPGLYIEELPSSAHTITAAPTSITAFVGYVHPFQGECVRDGLWNRAIRIFDFTDFERIFGGLYNNAVLGKSDVAYAVNQFFLNGGADAYVVGLQPQYFDADNLAAAPEAITPASATLSNIVFTSRQLTDAANQVTVTIRNVSATGDVADIMVTFASQVETYRGVKTRSGDPSTYMDPSTTTFDKDFIGNRLAGSRLVSVVQPGTGAHGGPFPATYTITGRQQSIDLGAMPAPTTITNPTMYRDKEFLDAFAADSWLDKVDIFNILVVPGNSAAAVRDNALHFCLEKRAFFVMDAPSQTTADGAGSGLATAEDFVRGISTPGVPNGALYFPYLKTIDPLTGAVIDLPPSGYVAGVYARTDTNRGVWKAPAGLETSLVNTTGVVDRGRMTDMRQGTVNDLGVNVLRSFPGSGTVVWGARTIVTANPSFQQWRYVPVRRTALFIEQTLLRNLGWVVFEPNDQPLWSAIRFSIEGFMLSLFRQGAFQGATPSEAFLVKCDKSTTTQTDIDNGEVKILVGFRPLKPAEFVIIQITQLAGQVQA